MSLFKLVQASIRQQMEGAHGQQTVRGATPIVVAVSGGPDSMALLHLLAIQGLHPAKDIVVAHLDHGLRPSSSTDAQFVTEIAADWGLACEVKHEDVAHLAKASGLSLEEAGRTARYDFLAQVAKQNNSTLVATGHNADDQAETVLMHFVRGSGLAGLRGMLAVGPLPGSPDLTLIRPLLGASRAAIEAYCAENNVLTRKDASNQDTTFFRNRIRHELLPLLADYNPQIKERLQHTAAIATADHELMQKWIALAWISIEIGHGPSWVKLDLAKWRSLALALRRATLRKAVQQLRPDQRDIGFKAIEQARLIGEGTNVGSKSTLPGALTMTVGYDHLSIATSADALPKHDLPQLKAGPISLTVPGRVALDDDWILEAIEAGEVDVAEIALNRDPWLAFANIDDHDELTVRPVKRGERMEPLGMRGRSTKISDVMINRKLAAILRVRWPVVASAANPIWLVGHLLDERARVDPKSRRIVMLRAMKREKYEGE